MQFVQFERLLASTAFGLILALSSYPGLAQQSAQTTAQAAPMPAPSSGPGQKDMAPAKPALADAAKDESKPAPADTAEDASKPAAAYTTKDESQPAATDAAKDEGQPVSADTVKDESKAAATDTAKDESKPAPADTAKDQTKPAAADTAKDESKPAATDTAKDESKPAPADTAKDESKAAPADTAKDESQPKQDAAAPTTEPAQAATAPQAAPAPPSMDTQVADALRNFINGRRLDYYVRRKEDRAGVEKYYSEHDYKPIWTDDGKEDAHAKAAIVFLGQVQTDGLVPSDYPTPDFASAVTPEDLAEAELHLTNSVLKYARDAQIGRVHFSRVGADIAFKLAPPEPAEVLAKVSDAADVAKTLDGYNPPQAGFQALKKKLAELRATVGHVVMPGNDKPRVRVPQGHTLHLGMKDRRVIALRQRLDVPGDKNNPLYDQEVVDAVKAFQTGADLRADGLAGPNTIAALNGELHQGHRIPNDPIDTVIVNMERWRWLPRKLGNDEHTYVMVNVPDYTLKLMHDGQIDWKTKIVVGKPNKATPMTTAEMKYITVNPTWNVPPSIIENEYLPALQQDPTVLDRYGLKIYQDRNGTVHIYQPPGAGNALGRIRFNFPNKFLVYQHDTPDKYLFKRKKRAYSHGCMRVQDPLEYATKLLAIELPQDDYTPSKLRSMYGPDEININFPVPIPVHLTYQTAFVDRDGKLQFRDDIYGRDAKMIDIIKHRSERRVAYIPVQHAPNLSSQPVRLPPGTYGAYGSDDGYNGRYYGGGPSFFDFLFGGGRRYYEPQRRRYYGPQGFIRPHATDSGRLTRR